jgi:hypothetical protein
MLQINRLVILPLIFWSFGFGEDLVINGETTYLTGSQTFDKVIITNGGMLSLVEFGGSNPDQGILRLYCDSLHIDQTSSINGSGTGGAWGDGAGNNGLAGDGIGQYSGGGGGGFAGEGGSGGGDIPGLGGNINGSYNTLGRGSPGGFGFPVTASVGKGGGGIYISARSAHIAGDIVSNGTNGLQYLSPSNGGNGGGSGGMVWLDIETLTLTGNISTNGGNGAIKDPSHSYYAGGGGGGGGFIFITTKSLINTEQLSVLGGEGADIGNGYPGTDGADGIQRYQKIWLTSDSHSDEALWYLNPNPIIGMDADGDIYGYFYSLDQNPNGIADQTSNFTSQNTLQLDSLLDGTWYFHAVPMDNSYQLLADKHMSYQWNIHNSPLAVSSPTHPEEGVWYSNPNPVFNFETMAGIDDYYYIFDGSPLTIPTSASGTHLVNPTLIVPGNPDGSYFLHLAGMDESGYVGSNATHFQVNIGPPQPTLSIITPELNFTETPATMISSQQMVISNLGNGDLNINDVSFSNSMDFSIQDELPITVGVGGASQYFYVYFHPQEEGEYLDTMYLHSNDPSIPIANILLNGVATPAPTPVIELSLAEYDFGLVHMGQSASINVQISNLGDASLEITSISLLTGTQFAFEAPAIPFPIEPGNSADVLVSFNPTNDIAFYDFLFIESNDPINPSTNVIFDGTGDVELISNIVVTPPALNFGQVYVNQDSILTFSIGNTGNAELVLDGIVVADAEHFAVNPFNLVDPIPVGGTVDFEVIFSPNDSAMYSTTIYINSNDPTPPAFELTVTGWGIPPTAEISLDQASYDFGNIELGDEAEETLRIRNNGAEILTVDLQLESDHFHVSQSYCEIPAYSLYDVTLYFTPIDTGSFTESLVLLSNSTDIPELTVELQGSAYFGDIVIVPEAAPRIVAISDMPADQGGYVGIQFRGSDYDCCYNAYDVIEYSVWRELDLSLFRSTDFVALESDPNIQLLREDEYWEYMGSLPAVEFENYGFVAPTIKDSTEIGIPFNRYLIIAHTNMDDVQFISEPDSGYSVDNLSPSVPAGLTVVREGDNGALVTWEQNGEPDLSHYELYRDVNPIFDVTETTMISTQIDTFFIDESLVNDITYYYRLIAKDYHGNLSDATESASILIVDVDGNSTLPLSFTLSQNVPNPFNPSTTINYELPEDSDVSLIIYDVRGNLVEILESGTRGVGSHSVTWNGTASDGRLISTGIYFARMVAGDYNQVIKMLYLK